MTDPSQLPPPGWFPDPITGTGRRWWNGQEWTDHVSVESGTQPGAPQPQQWQPTEPKSLWGKNGHGLGPAGDFVSEAGSLLRRRAGHLLTIFAVVVLPTTLVFSVLIWNLVKDLVFINLQTPTDLEVVGFEASNAVLLGVATILTGLAGSIMNIATNRQLDLARQDAPEEWSASLKAAIPRLPRFIGVWLLIVLLFVVGLVVVLLVGALLGAISPAFWIVVIPLALFGILHAAVRVSLALTAASIAPSGVQSIKTSVAITKGHVGSVLGRLALLFLLLVGINFATQMLTTPLIQMGGGQQIEPGADVMAFGDMFGGPIPFVATQVISGVLSALGVAFWTAGVLVLYRRLGGPGLKADDQPGDIVG